MELFERNSIVGDVLWRALNLEDENFWGAGQEELAELARFFASEVLVEAAPCCGLYFSRSPRDGFWNRGGNTATINLQHERNHFCLMC